jgi:hypothetical protein
MEYFPREERLVGTRAAARKATSARMLGIVESLSIANVKDGIEQCGGTSRQCAQVLL